MSDNYAERILKQYIDVIRHEVSESVSEALIVHLSNKPVEVPIASSVRSLAHMYGSIAGLADVMCGPISVIIEDGFGTVDEEEAIREAQRITALVRKMVCDELEFKERLMESSTESSRRDSNEHQQRKRKTAKKEGGNGQAPKAG